MNRLLHILRITFLVMILCPTLLAPGAFAHTDCHEHAHEHEHSHEPVGEPDSNEEEDTPCSLCVAQAEHAGQVDDFPARSQFMGLSHDEVWLSDQAILARLDQATHSQRGPPAN